MPGQEVAPGCVLGPPEIHNAPPSATELAESQEGRHAQLVFRAFRRNESTLIKK